MKKISKIICLSVLFSIYCFSQSLFAQTLKPHHADAFGGQDCQTCHVDQKAFTAPDQETCIVCHGEMSEIKTELNKDNKYPHQSPHYGDLVSCSSCHSEHGESKAICNDCHIVNFPNLK